ncbi:hypothetical protein EV421DRAFT_433093 [Armillaria borealis]|uniref:Uncharacterized protein n=1 Tax=Armillaria borealis TaxID=47425 RepID=A0AA39K522_9AGAR|nr:hypothetical protein EV421DRAFT_433093 [Armillaria borealis]
MSKKITQDYLESLTRQEVQALAKEHGIRANLGTKVIISNLLAILPATAKSEPKEPPAKVNANKRRRNGAAEEPSQATKTPANASNEKAPAPPSKRRRVTPEPSKPSKAVTPSAPLADQADEEDEEYTTIAGQLEHHADTNGLRHEQLEDIYHVLAGMQKNLCERQPELVHHVNVRHAVEQILIVPMRTHRTLVDGSGFLPHAAALAWKKWHEENIIYPELFHPSNKIPEDAEEEAKSA